MLRRIGENFNVFENVISLLGFLCTFIIFVLPFFFKEIYFSTIIPGGLIGLGLPIFVHLRRRERRGEDHV